jgi:hypothetical protein
VNGNIFFLLFCSIIPFVWFNCSIKCINVHRNTTVL